VELFLYAFLVFGVEQQYFIKVFVLPNPSNDLLFSYNAQEDQIFKVFKLKIQKES
jgi:hypothetical protein